MADNDDIADTIRGIREAIVAAEEAHPDCPHVKRIHRRAHRGLVAHAALLGFSNEEAALLAGGGTPKQNPGGGG